MSFRLVPKSVNLNKLELHSDVILRYFSEFGQLPGALRKSSRSVCHLLMSSCQLLMMDYVSVSLIYISVSSPYFAHFVAVLLAHTSFNIQTVYLHNQQPRQLGAPFQATAAMLLADEVTATVWLPSCDVISARQCSCPISARQTVHLPLRALSG